MRAWLNKILIALCVAFTSFSGSVLASSSEAAPQYGSQWDYIWLVAILMVIFLFIMKKLFQMNSKNSKYQERLSSKNKKTK